MESLNIIDTKDQVDALIEYLADKDYVSFDTETTGVTKDASVIGLSLSAELDVGYYIIIEYWNKDKNELVQLDTVDSVPDLLNALLSKHLVMHNAVFDCAMIKNNFGISLLPALHTDTMVLGHLLNENRSNGLKELSTTIFGDDSTQEQKEMKESVILNGGVLTKEKYELYKADCKLLAKYGAKDATLTYKLFFHFIPELYEQNLQDFFYKDESMPLLKGPTYELNTIGLRIDADKLQKLKGELQAECLEAKSFIYSEIDAHIKDKYKGTNKSNTFNIGAPKQLSWLLFFKLQNRFNNLTESGKEICKSQGLRMPYSDKDKRDFLEFVTENKGKVYCEAKWNYKTKKMGRPKTIGDPWNYLTCGKDTLGKLSEKYKWVQKLLEYAKNLKLLNYYVEGIQSRTRYNIIHPSFFQHGTTSGRYSSKNPNFMNLPRDDKRVKSCVVSRPGKVFVGADYSQLEPRVFASVSKDEALMACFKNGEDFYSVVGAPIFNKTDCSLVKKDPNSFATKYPKLRDKAKTIALATPYGRTPAYQANSMGISIDESKNLINKYFEAWPKVELMMLESHEMVKSSGIVYSLFGRPRRIPEAAKINKLYGNSSHSELPYEIRTLLNLAMNHRVQSTGASIINRSSVEFYKRIKELGIEECYLVLQVHDELVVECLEKDAQQVSEILKDCMENTVSLDGVSLEAVPKISNNLGDLK